MVLESLYTNIKGILIAISYMRSYMADTWTNMWKLNSEELRSKAVLWREEPAIIKIPVAGRRPKHIGVVHIKQGISMRKVAERRVNERFPNLEVLGSYYLHKDGMYLWYEIVLADPNHPSISKDREMRGKLKAFAK
jgi:large subunit ribosomal protein L15e